MFTVPMAALALMLGGGSAGSAAPSRPAPLPIPARPMTLAQQTPAIIAVPLRMDGGCTAVQEAQPCTGRYGATLSEQQIRALAQLLGLKANFRPTESGQPGPYLDLSVTESRLGINGIGTEPSFVQGGEAYYSASQVLGFIAQVSAGAQFTATPRLTLHTDRATLDMGPLSPQQTRELLSELGWVAAQALLPHFLEQPLTCTQEGECEYPGSMIAVGGDPFQRIQTGLPAGEVALILTAAPQVEPSGHPGVLASVGVVEAGGWAKFSHLPTPVRLVGDPAKVTLRPQDAGNALLVRLTGVPVSELAQGTVQPH
ncbi:MAG: hypothetical protein Q4C67_00740 [Deinococcus sp.]|nr:hypothetical protein [Deinococcus sp.]